MKILKSHRGFEGRKPTDAGFHVMSHVKRESCTVEIYYVTNTSEMPVHAADGVTIIFLTKDVANVWHPPS